MCNNAQFNSVLPDEPSRRSNHYSAADYRRYICQQGMTLHDLYNGLKMYDPYAQFHVDENSVQDPVCLHSHSYYELIYCLQTVGVSYLVGPQHYYPQKGDLICILPGISHRPLFSEGESGSFCRIVLNINSGFVARLFRQYTAVTPEEVLGVELMRPSPENSARILQMFERGVQLSAVNTSRLEMIAIVLQILSMLEKISYNRGTHVKASNHNNILDELIEYIDQNYSQKLTLNDVAEHFFVSPSMISHICSDRLQISFYQFVQQRRLSEGQRLILNGLSMTEIAAKTGFSNYQNFYRAFKKAYGITPKEYRQLLVQEKSS